MSSAGDSAPRHEYDAVLLIAFGGPESLQEVPAFVTNVLGGRQLPAERMAEIVERYRLIGGRSPINEVVFRQARQLTGLLREEGLPLPVYVGMRDWSPSILDSLRRMASDGIRNAIGVILAPHQAEASWGRYQAAVSSAQEVLGSDAPRVTYAAAWYDHPLFIEAVIGRVRDALDALQPSERQSVRLLFTAHSIPVAMADQSPYVPQCLRSAELVASQCGGISWLLAYQSRSPFASQPWLEPDIYDVIRAESKRGTRTVVIVPLGFICDHLEVLYDLDRLAKAVADEVGVRFLRTGTVADHPAFLRMLCALIRPMRGSSPSCSSAAARSS